MKKLRDIPTILIICTFGLVTGCTKDKETGARVNFNFLEGFWYDQEGDGMKFIHFYSTSQACFGYGCGMTATYDTFNYRISGNTIAIDMTGDVKDTETIHPYSVIDDRTMEIGNLPLGPEKTLRKFKKLAIRDLLQKDTLELSVNEVYYDAINDLQLRLDSITTDSRCPTGVVCIWEGNAAARFELISGNQRILFSLNTNAGFQRDTVLNGFRFSLIQCLPYPEAGKTTEMEDYRISITIQSE